MFKCRSRRAAIHINQQSTIKKVNLDNLVKLMFNSLTTIWVRTGTSKLPPHS